MAAWLKRFGLHLAAAVGATGIFVAAAAVGASQTRQQEAVVSAPVTIVRTRTPAVQRRPSGVAVATSTPVAAAQPVAQTPVDASAPTTPPPTVAGQAPDVVLASPVPVQAPAGAAGPGQGQPAAAPKPEPDQPQPAVEPPPGVSKPGGATPPSPRPTERTTSTARPATSATSPGAAKVQPERSLAGTIKAVLADGLDVMGVGGREWHVIPAPGALIRLNGKAARLETLQAGDTLVILGQAQSGPGNPFLAHALTARRK